MSSSAKTSTPKPILPSPRARCPENEHEWGNDRFTLEGRAVVQSMDGIWRCDARRRRCHACGLVQDASFELEDWRDTTYPEDLVRAHAYDPRQPSGYEKKLLDQGYGPTAAYVLGQDPSIVEDGHVQLVAE